MTDRWLAGRLLAALIALGLMLVACSGGGEPTGIDGRWNGGEDWGEVIIDNLEGTYSSTFGTDLGVIELTNLGENTYEGTWNEGTVRFGTLRLTQDSNDVVTGEWTADPDSEISGSSGGLIRWERA